MRRTYIKARKALAEAVCTGATVREGKKTKIPLGWERIFTAETRGRRGKKEFGQDEQDL